MKIVRPASEEEVLQTIAQGARTTWTRVNSEQKEYTCPACRKTFFSSGLILHDLCDEDWAAYNLIAFSKRANGIYYAVDRWLQDRNTYSFTEGCMCEGGRWDIITSYSCSELSGGKPCRHCHGDHTVTKVRYDKSEYYEQEWICPRVVVACGIVVCLDCILEAAKEIIAKGEG